MPKLKLKDLFSTVSDFLLNILFATSYSQPEDPPHYFYKGLVRLVRPREDKGTSASRTGDKGPLAPCTGNTGRLTACW
jgi:hypothetical protein